MGKYKLDLQLFAAPDGMTGQGDLEVKAREIDFVTSFGKNIQALLDVLGIARMIRKENGSALKTKEVTQTRINRALLHIMLGIKK